MRLRFVYIAALACTAFACKSQQTSASYTVGGTIIGLNGSLTLTNNGKDPVTVSAGSAFVFPTAIPSGDLYAVAISSQPYGQTCLVNGGSGTVGNANITDIRITCVTTAVRYTIGGALSGLLPGAGTVVLSNSADQINVSASGPFVFPTTVSSGTAYDVEVVSTPGGWTCTVIQGIGTVDIKNISTVQVSCTNVPSHSLGGTMTGLPSDGSVGVSLVNNGDRLTVSTNGPFTFPGRVPEHARYNVIVDNAPGGWRCTTQDTNDVMGNANVTSVAVSCTQLQYTLQGNIIGAAGPWSITDGNNTLILNSNTTFGFSGYHYGDNYNVTVGIAPSNEVCFIQGGVGTVTNNVTNIVITCSAPRKITGTVSSANSNFTIAVNGGYVTTVPANASTFEVDNVVDGTHYNVTVVQHPTGQKCTVTGGNGTVSGGDASGVNIGCVAAYTVTGSLTGNANGLLLRVTDGNTVDRVPVSGTSFSVPITAGNNYKVESFASPRGQTCGFSGSVTNNQGTAIAANVAGANIACSTATYFLFGTGTFTPISGYSGIPVSATAQSSTSSQNTTVAQTTYSYRFTNFTAQDTVTVSYVAPPGQSCIMPSSSTYVFDRANLATGDIVCK